MSFTRPKFTFLLIFLSQIIIHPTDEGLEHIEEIAVCVFAYFGMLIREGPQMWYERTLSVCVYECMSV